MSVEAINPNNEQSPLEIDPFKLQNFMKKAKAGQNLPLGLLAGIAAALIGAVIWAAITIVTDYQIGFMAVGIGFLVGLAIRVVGKGIDRVFGITGAVLALFGCLAGNVLTMAIIISQQEAIPFFYVFLFLATTPAAVIELMAISFSPIDLLFYGIAIYAGYKYSFRRFSRAEVANLLAGSP